MSRDELVALRGIKLWRQEQAALSRANHLQAAEFHRKQMNELADEVNALQLAILGYPPPSEACQVDVPAVVEGRGEG